MHSCRCKQGNHYADYEMWALKGGVDSVKVVKVVRRLVRGQYKYYVQLTIEGEKPQKGRTLGWGNVGIDLGPTTVAVSGELLRHSNGIEVLEPLELREKMRQHDSRNS